MSNRLNNCNGLINSAETQALITSLGEPMLSRLRIEEDKKIVSIIQLDPTASHDRKIYSRLYNETEKFEVISETEHGGKFSAIIVVRYYCKTEEDVGKSFAEMRQGERAKEKKKKAPTKPSRKKAKATPRKKAEGKIGFAP